MFFRRGKRSRFAIDPNKETNFKAPTPREEEEESEKTFFSRAALELSGAKKARHIFCPSSSSFPEEKTPPRPCCGEWGGGGPPRLWWRVGVEFFIKSFFEGWRKNKSCPTTTAPLLLALRELKDCAFPSVKKYLTLLLGFRTISKVSIPRPFFTIFLMF